MKSTQSRRKKKTLTIAQRARQAYNRLSKKLKEEIGYSVVRQYYRLSKEYRQYTKGEEIPIWRMTANAIKMGYNITDEGAKSAYDIMKESIRYPYRRTKRGSLREYFSQFRNEKPDVYAKYNSYMYRQGFSSANYFYEKAKIETNGSIITITLELPTKTKGISYDALVITKDYSQDEFEATME